MGSTFQPKLCLARSVDGTPIQAPFTPQEREALRAELIETAQNNPRITGGAITGSTAAGNEDCWSDIDLGFGVRDAAELRTVLEDFSARMYEQFGAVHHLDVPSGAWIYRVFLLRSTLQVDLAFAPAADFGARGPNFKLVFGKTTEQPYVAPPVAEELIGWGWLYALHVRSSIARAKLWQAEYMVSAMRDQVLALACLRHCLPAREGRGIDRLPPEVTKPLEDALVRSINPRELRRAFKAVNDGLIQEMRCVNIRVVAQPSSVASSGGVPAARTTRRDARSTRRRGRLRYDAGRLEQTLRRLSEF